MPRLEPGLCLLRAPAATRPVKPLQSLVVDTLLLGSSSGQAVWVDAFDHARTDILSSLAPSQRLLDRIQVARGFTPHQHAAIVEHLFTTLRGDGTPPVSPASLSLLVCPAVDALYREDDIRDDVAESLCYRVLARLSALARAYEVPVLVSTWQADALTAPFETAADTTITCTQTDFGIWFETDETETLVYPLGDGTVQTTLAYWAEILRARQPLYDRHSVGEAEPISSTTLRG